MPLPLRAPTARIRSCKTARGILACSIIHRIRGAACILHDTAPTENNGQGPAQMKREVDRCPVCIRTSQDCICFLAQYCKSSDCRLSSSSTNFICHARLPGMNFYGWHASHSQSHSYSHSHSQFQSQSPAN